MRLADKFSAAYKLMLKTAGSEYTLIQGGTSTPMLAKSNMAFPKSSDMVNALDQADTVLYTEDIEPAPNKGDRVRDPDGKKWVVDMVYPHRFGSERLGYVLGLKS